jgi:hypothetical protein
MHEDDSASGTAPESSYWSRRGSALLGLVAVGLLSLTCQPPPQSPPVPAATTAWMKSYGPTFSNSTVSLHATGDSGLVTAATTVVNGEYMRMWVVRTDANGETVWERNYGSADSTLLAVGTEGSMAQPTSDGGYIVVGTISWRDSIPNSKSAAWLVKTDASGDTEWTRRFAEFDGDQYCGVKSVAQLLDGGYIVGGFSQGEVAVMRTNAQGESLWLARAGPYTHRPTAVGPVEYVQDGGFVVPSTVQWVESAPRTHLLRIESDGTESWNLEERSMRYARAVRALPSGGYVVVGRDLTGGFLFGHHCFSLLRVSAQGQTVRVMKSEAGEGWAIDLAPDGCYVLAGSNEEQPCIVKVDTLGQTIWKGQVAELQGTFAAVVATGDGGAIAAGVARDVAGSRFNVVLLKFNPPEE